MKKFLTNKAAALVAVVLLVLVALNLAPTVLTAYRAPSMVNYDAGLAARWQAMGEFYQAQARQAALVRGNDASAARWEALGAYYLRIQADAIQRGRAADAARWQAMAAYYAKAHGK